MSLIFIIFGSLLACALLLWGLRILYMKYVERKAISKLCRMLFPNGEQQKQDVIDGIMALTNNRFSRGDVLDYYLKIKGLQIIDMHTNSNGGVRRYLLKQTKIRLNYFEQVKFYEAYLNYPQAVGSSVLDV